MLFVAHVRGAVIHHAVSVWRALKEKSMLRSILLVFKVVLFSLIVLYNPGATSEPAANPEDPARENLARIEYPSQSAIPWVAKFIKPQDTLEKLFGNDWIYVARFNRIDRRHVYPGMTIKVPTDMDMIRGYTPMPAIYEPARRYDKYILINITEQWLGAYEKGKLMFSIPAATGKDGYNTPTGLFRVDAHHKNHTSSLYKTEDEQGQYPMDNAIRFYIGSDNISYWIHARDLPGRPASHGCIGVYDEVMQKREYDVPEVPQLNDSKKLYDWAVGEEELEYDTGELELLDDGPVVEVIGENPRYKEKSSFAFSRKISNGS